MPREYLKDGTEVTSWADRRLLLRAVDECLTQSELIGKLAAAQARTEGEVRALQIAKADHEKRILELEAGRGKLPSMADVEEIAEDAARKAVDESGAHNVLPADAITPNKLEARFLKEKLDEALRELAEKKANADGAAKEKRDRLWAVLGPVIAAVIIAAGGIAYGIFRTVESAGKAADAEERGRLRGRAEVEAAPPVMVPVPMPSALQPPPSAPADAAPRGPRHP
jgi:hypothetical protein